jgi:hypothetical protein
MDSGVPTPGTTKPNPQPVPPPVYDVGPLQGTPVPGMVQSGNIDVNHRPGIRNEDGSYSSIYSATIPLDEKGELWPEEDYDHAPRYALIPQIADGKFLTSSGKKPDEKDKEANDALYEEAKKHYVKTKEHLGVFSSGDAADKYAGQTHAWTNTGTPDRVYTPSYKGEGNMPDKDPKEMKKLRLEE